MIIVIKKFQPHCLTKLWLALFIISLCLLVCLYLLCPNTISFVSGKFCSTFLPTNCIFPYLFNLCAIFYAHSTIFQCYQHIFASKNIFVETLGTLHLHLSPPFIMYMYIISFLHNYSFPLMYLINSSFSRLFLTTPLTDSYKLPFGNIKHSWDKFCKQLVNLKRVLDSFA